MRAIMGIVANSIARRGKAGFRARKRQLVTGLLMLTISACVEDDPRYPVYYRFMVDVKVDGQPVRIERVIKCTGTLVSGSTYAPGVTTGGTYANPPVMGAWVPGSKAAVYTPVVGACKWAAASEADIEEEEGRVHRFLTRPLTEDHRSLRPGSLLPVLWVADANTFAQMEYYVSERTLTGIDSHVEFVKAHPPVKVDKQAFRESERRAETDSPDLTPFIFPRDQNAARKLRLYKERFENAGSGHRVHAICHAAWRIPREEWSQVEGLDDWVASLPDDGRAYQISSELSLPFWELIPFRGSPNTPSLGPIGYAPERDIQETGRFAFYDTIHPVISTDQGRYVDLNRSGAFGCNYSVMFPDRKQIARQMSVDRSTGPSASYPIRFEQNRLFAQFTPTLSPVFVRELDEFIIFMSLSMGGAIDEPVVKGWKE